MLWKEISTTFGVTAELWTGWRKDVSFIHTPKTSPALAQSWYQGSTKLCRSRLISFWCLPSRTASISTLGDAPQENDGKRPRFGHVYQKISKDSDFVFYYWRVEVRKQFWKEMLIWTVVLQIDGKWLTPSQKLDLEEVLRTETSSCAKDTTTSCTSTCSFG